MSEASKSFSVRVSGSVASRREENDVESAAALAPANFVVAGINQAMHLAWPKEPGRRCKRNIESHAPAYTR